MLINLKQHGISWRNIAIRVDIIILGDWARQREASVRDGCRGINMRAKATIAGSCCQKDLSGIYEYGLWEQSSVDE